MLGEDHSLLNEFPEFKELIKQLILDDESFSDSASQYDELDEKIRNLELNDSPISDSEMHKMKHDRSKLKDFLFKKLMSHASKN